MSIGQKIRDARKQNNISLRKLAELCCFDPAYLSRVETGKTEPHYKNLLALSWALQVSVEDLLTDYRDVLHIPAAPSKEGKNLFNNPVRIPIFNGQDTAKQILHGLRSRVGPSLIFPRALCFAPKMAGFIMSDDSMISRSLNKHDLVISCVGQSVIKSGELAIVGVGNEQITLREIVTPLGDKKQIILNSAHPDKNKYPDRVVKRSNIKLIYRIISIYKTMDQQINLKSAISTTPGDMLPALVAEVSYVGFDPIKSRSKRSVK